MELAMKMQRLQQGWTDSLHTMEVYSLLTAPDGPFLDVLLLPLGDLAACESHCTLSISCVLPAAAALSLSCHALIVLSYFDLMYSLQSTL